MYRRHRHRQTLLAALTVYNTEIYNTFFIGVDRLSAWPIIAVNIKYFYDNRIGHFQNRCADKII